MMDKKKDPVEQIILEDIQMEAEMIKKEVKGANVETMPPEVKDKIKKRLYAQIAEREKENTYAKLSEEDRKALELGREMLRKQQEAAKGEEKVVRYRKPKNVYVAMAAVMVMVFAMGVTSMGGPKRVVQMIQAMIGERALIQVNSNDDNYIVEKDREEEAYEKLKDTFGVEPVKIIHQLDGMKFVTSEIDEELQTALLIYDVNGGNLQYYITSHFTDSSWGFDIEDNIVNEYYIEHRKKGKIKLIEYETTEDETKSYSVNYTHKGLEYVLTGTMNKRDFEELVKNLKFF